jgi:hypothetical protein
MVLLPLTPSLFLSAPGRLMAPCIQFFLAIGTSCMNAHNYHIADVVIQGLVWYGAPMYEVFLFIFAIFVTNVGAMVWLHVLSPNLLTKQRKRHEKPIQF